MTAPNYRFKCMIVNDDEEILVISDHTHLEVDRIDQFGGCESVDHTVARMMRQFKTIERKQREKAS